MKLIFKCTRCRSEDVVRDAWASWDYDKQEWVIDNVFDEGFCNDCNDTANVDCEEVIE